MYRNKVNHAYRLERQVSQSIFEYKEYNVKKIRYKSYSEPLLLLRSWDAPYRKVEMNWKSQRKLQFKGH